MTRRITGRNDLANAELVESVPTLTAEELASVMGPHSRAKTLFTGPLNMADSSFVMHCRSLPGARSRPANPSKSEVGQFI